jgi:hypothetical protein
VIGIEDVVLDHFACEVERMIGTCSWARETCYRWLIRGHSPSLLDRPPARPSPERRLLLVSKTLSQCLWLSRRSVSIRIFDAAPRDVMRSTESLSLTKEVGDSDRASRSPSLLARPRENWLCLPHQLYHNDGLLYTSSRRTSSRSCSRRICGRMLIQWKILCPGMRFQLAKDG